MVFRNGSERESNTIILYPLADCNGNTLLSIIQRYCAPGSTIYCDSWSALLNFNISPQYTSTLSKNMFVNKDTGELELVEIHTNRIEGASVPERKEYFHFVWCVLR